MEIHLETTKPLCLIGEVHLRQVFYPGSQNFPAEIPSLVHSGDWLANKPFINNPPFLESLSHFRVSVSWNRLLGTPLPCESLSQCLLLRKAREDSHSMLIFNAQLESLSQHGLKDLLYLHKWNESLLLFSGINFIRLLESN